MTLPHEHVIVDARLERRDAVLHDEKLMSEELRRFADAGGGTIVELTMEDFGRDPAALRRISEASGVHIVMGCGHYRDPYLDRGYFDRAGLNGVAEDLIREIEHGVGETGIRPGIIGEIGADRAYISAAEERSFRAAARAHVATGLTITTHACYSPVGLAQVELLQSEGVDPRRVIVGHCDTYPVPEFHATLADLGCFVEFDVIGTGNPHDWDNHIAFTLELLRSGRGSQVLLSQDMFLPGHLAVNGGCGYAHTLEEFVPALQAKGVTDEEIELLTVENPRAALTGERSS